MTTPAIPTPRGELWDRPDDPPLGRLTAALRRVAAVEYGTATEWAQLLADRARLATECARLRDELLMAQSRYSGQPRTEAFGSIGEVTA